MLGQFLLVAGGTLVGAVVVVGIAGQVARRRLRASLRPAGRLVDVGGYRLHVEVRGSGRPAVVLEGGTWAPAAYWRLIAEQLAADATVVTYDRAGLGHSDPGGRPRTAAAMADELRAALSAAGVAGPYVLVGHSSGGTIARMFAHRHPADVAGLVLVDASHEDQFERAPEPIRVFQRRMSGMIRPMFTIVGLAARLGILALRPRLVPGAAAGLPPAVIDDWRASVAARPSVVATMAREMLDLDASNAEVRAARITSLGSVPLVVLSHGRPEGSPPQLGPDVAAAYEAVWQELQAEQAALSSRGRRVVVDGAGHDIPTERPDAVVAAVHEVLARSREPLGAIA